MKQVSLDCNAAKSEKTDKFLGNYKPCEQLKSWWNVCAQTMKMRCLGKTHFATEVVMASATRFSASAPIVWFVGRARLLPSRWDDRFSAGSRLGRGPAPPPIPRLGGETLKKVFP